MKRKFLTLTSAVLGSLLLAATAHATSCGGIEFALVAQGTIGMQEPSTINGNVLSTNGTVTIGISTVVNGAVYAPSIVINPNGAAGRITECHGTVTGDAAACAAVFPFDPPAACVGVFPPPPLVAPVADPCVDTPAAVNRTFSAANNNTPANDLATDCYKTLRLNAGAIVRLVGAGPHIFRNIQLLGGSHLRAEPDLPTGTQRTVNVNTTITTDPNTTMTDLLINVAGTQGSLVLANNTTLNNTTINSPFRNVHPRTGTQLLECSELIGDTLTVEPINTECGFQIPCDCPDGFEPEFPVQCVPIVR